MNKPLKVCSDHFGTEFVAAFGEIKKNFSLVCAEYSNQSPDLIQEFTIVHYPGGGPKMISKATLVSTLKNNEFKFGYKVKISDRNTENGSSGGGIFNDKDEWIGIHTDRSLTKEDFDNENSEFETDDICLGGTKFVNFKNMNQLVLECFPFTVNIVKTVTAE
jgi:V8-like Glu-specific endopeptidase